MNDEAITSKTLVEHFLVRHSLLNWH